MNFWSRNFLKGASRTRMLGKISEETLAKTFEVMLEALSAKCPVKILRDPFFFRKDLSGEFIKEH